ncbi:9112_t:CDS:2 [Funneliformis geosporum]|uniref:13465_t:CDS:1 n=1 Tax=Funneliformis geosporum TaxID=1117311 RepID=A0A9W4SEU3_9GLOM|nr:13465_t:CDS:2 [Funneliformis geosporum]CAI2168551.1 9112_t:CDS:2 [Funneliformis geosporum]
MTLQDIHSSGFIHRNLHSGNILQTDQGYPKINDLSLSKFIDNKKNQLLYGVLPYVAPEVLRGEEFTSAADVYSFSMIMWEISSGMPLFSNRKHDTQLAIEICNGMRPKIVSGTPKSFSMLMERCWDSDPLLRPSVQEITAMLFRWHFHLEQNRSIDICNAFMISNYEKRYFQPSNSLQDVTSTIEINYNSQLLNFKDLPEPTNFYTRTGYDSGFGSLSNTSSIRHRVSESLASSDSCDKSPTRPLYVNLLRKQYQFDATCIIYAEPESYLNINSDDEKGSETTFAMDYEIMDKPKQIEPIYTTENIVVSYSLRV